MHVVRYAAAVAAIEQAAMKLMLNRTVPSLFELNFYSFGSQLALVNVSLQRMAGCVL